MQPLKEKLGKLRYIGSQNWGVRWVVLTVAVVPVVLRRLLNDTSANEYASARLASSSSLNFFDWISVLWGTTRVVHNNSDWSGAGVIGTDTELDTTWETVRDGETTWLEEAWEVEDSWLVECWKDEDTCVVESGGAFDNTDVVVGRGDAVLDSTETEMLLATLVWEALGLEMLELMVGTVERPTLLKELSPGVNVAFPTKDCVREIFTVRVGNGTT